MTTNRQGSKTGNAEADLEARVRVLEERLRMMTARPAIRRSQDDRVVIRVTQEAHEFEVGDWVMFGSLGVWDLALAWPQITNLLHEHPIAPLHNRLCGVVSAVSGADAFTVTVGGVVEGISNAGGNFTVGRTYRLSEVDEGEVTEDVTSTNMQCFVATGAQAGIVLQAWDALGHNELRIGALGEVGQVLYEDDLADAADVEDINLLSIIVTEGDDTTSICRAGWCYVGDDTLPNAGMHWLDPSNPGELTSTRPTTPAAQRPVAVLYHYGSGLCWMRPTPMAELGISDLWDVDLSTPPTEGDGLVWNNTSQRFEPRAVLPDQADGPSVLARIESGVGQVVAFQVNVSWGALVDNGSGQLEWKLLTPGHLADFPAYSILANESGSAAEAIYLEAGTDVVLGRGPSGDLDFMKIVTTQLTDKLVTAAKLADALAYTVVGNGTSATASPTGITAGNDGTVLRRIGTSLAFSATLKLGNSAAAGSLSIHDASDIEQVSLDTTGNGGLITLNEEGGSARGTIGIDSASSLVIDGVNQLSLTGVIVVIGESGGSQGFFGSGGTTKPTITGSRGGNAALADLLTKLASMNLLNDSTS